MNEDTREWLHDQIDGYMDDDMNEAATKGAETGYEIGREIGYKKGFEAGRKVALSWLTIESAPKDGTEIFLLKKGDRFPTVGFRIDDKWQAVESGLWLEPNWWLPLSALPPAPEVSGD